MKPEQAFDILVQTTGQIQANRETHVAIQQALDVVKRLVEESKSQQEVKKEQPKPTN